MKSSSHLLDPSGICANELKEIKNLIHHYEATYLIDGEWDYAYTGPLNHPILQNLDPARLAKMVPLESLQSVVKVLILTSNNMEDLAEKLIQRGVYVNNHQGIIKIEVFSYGV